VEDSLAVQVKVPVIVNMVECFTVTQQMVSQQNQAVLTPTPRCIQEMSLRQTKVYPPQVESSGLIGTDQVEGKT
jgi:hypothetical protein